MAGGNIYVSDISKETMCIALMIAVRNNLEKVDIGCTVFYWDDGPNPRGKTVDACMFIDSDHAGDRDLANQEAVS